MYEHKTNEQPTSISPSCAFISKPKLPFGAQQTKEENNNTLLSVHHVKYNKDACCTDESPRMFVPLCMSCHAATTNSKKKYEQHIEELLIEKYNGKCYYTREEYYGKIDC